MGRHAKHCGGFHALLGLCLLAACESSDVAGDAAVDPAASPSNADLPGFCAREGDDAVRDVFCAQPRPPIQSMSELQALLGLTPVRPEAPDAVFDPHAARFVFLGLSTSLSGHLTSPINPRLILLGEDTIAAFQRGVQRVELVSPDRGDQRLTFYLVSFEQACNGTARGCLPGDLYTPRIEERWTSVRINDDEELKNAPADCRQCHQRGVEQPRLLMRELDSPWTHFLFPPSFQDVLPGDHGGELTNDYLEAKGDELYGGASMAALDPASVFELQLLVGEPQPLLFAAPEILIERYPHASDGYPAEPKPSPTWEAGYDAFKRGEALPLPYFDTRSTDPDKQARLTAAYQRFRAGEITADELPDLSDIFPDDPNLRARIGLQTEHAASPQQTLIQACGSCHNDVLDQSIGRARFNIDISRLERAELAIAIARIELDRHVPGAMPPAEARALDPAARSKLIDFLRDEASRLQPDPELVHAAKHGMAGGAGP